MEIREKRIKIREVVENYSNDLEEGVTGYNGRLNIRPKYQREFVYKDEQRDEVIRTILKGFPINVIYWSISDDGNYELLDGQQRTISFCEYIAGNFSVDNMYFSNLPSDIQEKMLDYELFVYICSGEESERLDWFKVINIAGEVLTDQELRNATYTGPWLTDAKRYFSKTGCPADSLAGDYLKGSSIRQEYLETALSWIGDKENLVIEDYMAMHHKDPTAQELWSYFRSVIDWVQAIFPKVRPQMKGLPWGIYYNKHGNRKDLDPIVLEEKVTYLMGDEDVTRKSGIYEYLLTGNEKLLSIRSFDNRDKLAAYERQNHRCPLCGKEYEFEEMHGDHIIPWSKGGKTTPDNCQMLCINCNIKKSNY